LFNFYLKVLLYFIGLLTLDLPYLHLKHVRSETNSGLNLVDSQKTNKIILNKNLKISNIKNIEIGKNISSQFTNYLITDIKKSKNKLINQLAFDNNSNIDNFSLEIESNIQYEIENVYYAEGNAIIYFSNAILKGDKVEYDKSNKTIKVIGNVFYTKGDQYFEASEVFYNLESDEGYIDNIYGVLDMKSFVKDFEFKNVDEEYVLSNNNDELKDLEYVDNVNIGLVNDFEKNKKFNLTNIKFDIPSIKKWRYKSKKILLENSQLIAEEILFTNDALNKPQFILRSRDFLGEIIEDKVKLVSRKSTIILDDKLQIPIGKRTIYDKDAISSWGIGSDYEEKDGFYLSKGFDPIYINDNLNLKFRPYILIQRGLQGTTKSFREPKSSLLSPKVENNILISDLFAFDSTLNGYFNDFKIYLNTRLNTINTNRLSESIRSKFILMKSINLNKNNESINNQFKNDNSLTNFVDLASLEENDNSLTNFEDIESIEENDNYLENNYFKEENLEKGRFENILDLKYTSSFRDTISRGYSGEHEIYFGNSLSISNRKSWISKKNTTDIAFIYNIGKFKAKSKNHNIFKDLYRNVFASKLSWNISLWDKNLINKNINSTYKYSPNVINEGINWITDVQSGVFLYSDGSSQKGLTISSGPNFVFGQFKNKFFDYTSLTLRNSYVLKSGESPFAFDDINKSFRLNMNIQQQIYGPIVFGYQTSLNLDDGEFSKPNYNLDFKRRAYSLGAFYNTSNKILGINFNIFNFDYSGKSEKF
tara:strand:+ start:118 stop:2406 length:2289 start_codon:yes stop_codon:yes gene_type:complete